MNKKRTQKRTEGTDKNRFLNSRIKKKQKNERKKKLSNACCLHNQQDLYWGEYLKGH